MEIYKTENRKPKKYDAEPAGGPSHSASPAPLRVTVTLTVTKTLIHLY